MSFQLRPAERKQVKMRLGLSGASGFGKTYSALLLAYGLTGDWTKIAVIDTENRSSELYSHLGPFNVLPLDAPFSPERYMEAIVTCERAEMEVIIIDSISHEWEGPGGVIEEVDRIGGGYQGGWKVMTPKHDKFKHTIVSSPCHVITTVRRKQDYVMQETTNRQGKTVQAPVKVGTKEVTRDGWEYELTVNLELVNDKNMARASKDRTGLFSDRPDFVITPEVGREIKEWCETGKALDMQEIKDKLALCNTTAEVKMLWETYPELQYNQEAKDVFNNRRTELKQMKTAAAN